MFYVIGRTKDGKDYREAARNMAMLSLVLADRDPDRLPPHTIEGTKAPARLPALLREYLETHAVTYRIRRDQDFPDQLREAERRYQEALSRMQATRAELTEAENNFSALFDNLRQT